MTLTAASNRLHPRLHLQLRLRRLQLHLRLLLQLPRRLRLRLHLAHPDASRASFGEFYSYNHKVRKFE